MPLTGKQEMFCLEYVANNFNIIDAYIKAYKPENVENAKKNAYKNLKKPEVVARIRELQKERYEALNINADRIATELAEMAFAVKGDEDYTATVKLKALDLLQKQLGLQTQKVDAKVDNSIVLNITE